MREIRILLPNGGYLCCGEGAEYQWGGYVAIRDEQGEEVAYWEKEEWLNEPENVMGAIFSAAQKGAMEVRRLIGITKGRTVLLKELGHEHPTPPGTGADSDYL